MAWPDSGSGVVGLYLFIDSQRHFKTQNRKKEATKTHIDPGTS